MISALSNTFMSNVHTYLLYWGYTFLISHNLGVILIMVGLSVLVVTSGAHLGVIAS